MADDKDIELDKLAKARIRNVKYLQECFLLDENIISCYLDNGISYLELKKICLCSYISKKSIDEIIELRKKYVWTRTLFLLGINALDLDNGEKEYKARRFERVLGIDYNLVMQYQNLGFASHQIKRAYYISNHCDKPINEILEMKLRNKKWSVIANELGLPDDACLNSKKV